MRDVDSIVFHGGEDGEAVWLVLLHVAAEGGLHGG
jgi:hypothetical protein